MFAVYSRTTQTAFAAMTYLAEQYDGGKTPIPAAQIAAARDLQTPFLGKVLSTLSNADLITGSRGPGGGFTLSRPPREIVLFDIFELFERTDRDQEQSACPFGEGICGEGDKCPLHDKFLRIRESIDRILHETTLQKFKTAADRRK